MTTKEPLPTDSTDNKSTVDLTHISDGVVMDGSEEKITLDSRHKMFVLDYVK